MNGQTTTVTCKGKALVYFVKDDPVAVYMADSNTLITGKKGIYPDGYGDLPEIAMRVVEKLNGHVKGMTLDQFKSLVDSFIGTPANGREELLLGAIYRATTIHEDMVSVAKIRQVLLDQEVPDAKEGWVNSIIYRMYKAGKIRGVKRGSKLVYSRLQDEF